MATTLSSLLTHNKEAFYPVIQIKDGDTILALDLSQNNPALAPELVADTETFSQFINSTLQNAGCQYGIGGYNELRNLYARSTVFNGEEPRRLHLGVDIWGPVNTPVFAPLTSIIHSIGNNPAFGDYGATIILQHQLKNQVFHTLYGHLSLQSLVNKEAGQTIAAGENIAWFGPPIENGHWPPHLHFQVIENMEGMVGDYPGVCRFSEREKYLQNCPDANWLLQSLMGRIKQVKM